MLVEQNIHNDCRCRRKRHDGELYRIVGRILSREFQHGKRKCLPLRRAELAMMNSFQLFKKVMIATVAIDGFNIGVIIWNTIR